MTKVSERPTPASHGPGDDPRASSARRDSVTDPLSYLDGHPQAWNLILEALPDGTALLDAHGVMRHVNDALSRISGYSREELVGQNVLMLVPPRLRGLEDSARRQNARHPDKALIWSDQDLSMLCKGGRELSVDFALSTLEIDGRSWAVAAVRDSSARLAAEAARADVELRFRVAFESNMAPMSFADVHDRIIAVNDAFCQMVGFSREELIGQDSTPFTYPEDVGITERTLSRAINGELDQERYEKRYLRKDGRVIDVEVSRSPARDATGKILYFVFSERDVTEERALNAQLKHRALHDPLTGLANRALFEDRLIQAHARVVRQGGYGAVLLVDLDDFKGVNDTHGHFAGDQLLIALSHRLDEATRASDTLCRFGGDEFLYLAEGLTSREEAETLAERLIEVIAVPCTIGETVISQRASVGMVVWDSDDSDAGEIIQNVDAALFEAKSSGRGHHVVFTPSMHQRAVNRFSLAQELPQALQTGEISMYYQPIADLSTGTVVGFEALMRWRHPQRGFVPPIEFIPLAEQSDLILELGQFALREAIHEARMWDSDDTGVSGPYVTVNMSARQFLAPGLVDSIARMLAEAQLVPSRLVLEITETVVMADDTETKLVLAALGRLGVGIALDDFGTGYSSLSYLSALNPRIVKIDQSFVRPTEENARNDLLLESIISLGQRLHMTMLAEGIETRVQFHRVRRMGCELGQGYLFSPAVPTDEAGAMVGRVLAH
ncbi:MAG: putative bifunctional diguanylate cyclase/phosphodiesterase [Acidimicrobiales bacterium]